MNNPQIPTRRLIGLFTGIGILVVLPFVFKKPYIMHLVIMTFVNIVLGMTFSMLISTGLITLGAAAFYGIGAYASALFAMKLNLSFWFSLPLATIITAVIALGLGSVIVTHPGVAFVVITMVFSMIVAQVTGQIEFLGGWGGITGIPSPDPIGHVAFTSKTPYYFLMLFLLLLIALVFHALYQSRFGRIWQSIKVSPTLAETLGIHLYRYRLLAFVIASSASGAAGSFYAHYFQSITPEAFSGWISVYIQLYSVLGGLNLYILGPAVGAAIMTFIPEFLRGTKEIEPIVTGILLLIILLFFPGGILGTLKQFVAKRS
jgi:branched-chain amino acid transport system permease protein